MYDDITLISKPSKPNICALICAVARDDFSEISKHNWYTIENRFGKRFEIYARDDNDFSKKLVKNHMNISTMTTNPTFF